jgi:hypothetical protein
MVPTATLLVLLNGPTPRFPEDQYYRDRRGKGGCDGASCAIQDAEHNE